MSSSLVTPRLRSVDLESCARRPRHVSHSCCTPLNPFALFTNPPFTDADWVRHGGWRRLLPRSSASVLRVVAFYWPPLAVEAAVACAVVGYQATAVRHAGWPTLSHTDLITPLSLTAFLLGLLLVFRTNTAYDRWLEGRKLMGGVCGDTRTLARRIVAWSTRGRAGHPIPPAAAEALRWTAAAPVALAMRVATTPAERDAWAAGLVDVLPPETALMLSSAANPPGVVAAHLGAALASIDLCGPLLAAADATVDVFTQRCVAADRLRTQPTPQAYERNTARFMIVWLAFLPVALFDRFRWATPVPTVIVAFFLLAVENIAAMLEQPFAVLPMDVLVASALDGVTSLPAWHEARPAPVPVAVIPPAAVKEVDC